MFHLFYVKCWMEDLEGITLHSQGSFYQVLILLDFQLGPTGLFESTYTIEYLTSSMVSGSSDPVLILCQLSVVRFVDEVFSFASVKCTLEL